MEAGGSAVVRTDGGIAQRQRLRQKQRQKKSILRQCLAQWDLAEVIERRAMRKKGRLFRCSPGNNREDRCNEGVYFITTHSPCVNMINNFKHIHFAYG